jgi:RND family efflux transporter MFP subunit
MRKLIIVLGPILVLAGTIGIIAIMGALRPEPEEAEEQDAGEAVFVAEAERADITLNITTQGEVRPLREIDLIPEVGGKIVWVSPSFIDGGRFEEDEILIRIEPADYRLAVTRANANVADAQQALLREEAESMLAREEWADLGVGEATPLALRQPQLDQARARLDASNASLQEAQLSLARTEVRAPFPGRVRSKAADIGQYVSPGQRLAQLFSTETVEVRLPLTDAQLGMVGLPIGYFAQSADEGPQVLFDATVGGEPRQWRGRIVRTDAALDPQTRILHAIAQVQDPYGEGADNGAPMAVGLFVNARIDGRMVQDAVIIPRAGLRNLDQVYVAMPDNTLEIRTVQLVNATGERAVLSGGVEPGEHVVVSAMQSAVNGLALTPLVVDEPAGAAPADGAAVAATQSGAPL